MTLLCWLQYFHVLLNEEVYTCIILKPADLKLYYIRIRDQFQMVKSVEFFDKAKFCFFRLFDNINIQTTADKFAIMIKYTFLILNPFK